MALPKLDLTGRKFGDLTVLHKDTPYRTPGGTPSARWVCRCKCGKVKSIRATHLVSGKTKSCGCMRNVYLSKLIGKTNRFEVLGECTRVFTSNSESFIIDTRDIDAIKDLYWSIDSTGYVVNVKTGKRLHAFLMNCPQGLCVDHISGDKRDNRRCNLRICTYQQNSCNRHKSPRNKTGVLGVYKNARGKYVAQISANGFTHHLGTFATLEEATSVRRKAEQMYFGEFAGQLLNQEEKR